MIFFPISHFIVIFAPKFITDMDLFDRISADIKSAMLAKKTAFVWKHCAV